MGYPDSNLHFYWNNPEIRGILPLDRLHISRRLRRKLCSDVYKVTLNRNFHGIVKGCSNREDTWINDSIKFIYSVLHGKGYAHSIEVWQNEVLIGGLYGVSIGAVFFGESMYSNSPDASKIALAFLVDQLNRTGYHLLDIQYLTTHLESLGAIAIVRSEYLKLLAANIDNGNADLTSIPLAESGDLVVQRHIEMTSIVQNYNIY